MAFLEGGQDGVLTGTTPIAVVAAPAGGVRRLVKTIVIYNRDTVSHTIVLQYVSSGGTRYLGKWILAVDETLYWDSVLVLDGTSESIKAVSDAAATTTEPDYVSAFGDQS